MKPSTILAMVISGVGLLAIPTPVQATPMVPLAPGCTQYAFPGSFAIQQSNGYTLAFNATGQTVNGPGYAKAQTGQRNNGDVFGRIDGRDVVFSIEFDRGGRGIYNGTVDENGNVTGFTNSPEERVTWYGGRVICATAPSPPAPQAPAPPATEPAPKSADVGAIATGPAALQMGLSGTFVVTVSNKGGQPSAPVDLLVLFAGTLEQTGQIVADSGFCELRPPSAGINAAVHCTGPQLEPGAKYGITVQGRGSAPGAGKLLAKVGNDVNQKDVTVT